MINVKAIDHLNFTIKNFKETLGFYQSVFGFELLEEGFRMDGKPFKIVGIKGKFALCLSEEENFTKTESFNHFGLHVDNFDDVINILDERGIDYQYGGAVSYDHSRSVYTSDPNGHEIEISEVAVGGL